MALLRDWWVFLASGGAMMLPLGLCAFLVGLQGLSLLDWFRRHPSSHAGSGPAPWMCEVLRHARGGNPDAAVVAERFAEIRASFLPRLRRRIRFLGVCVAAAPLLGLLGTILGMLSLFRGMGGDVGGVLGRTLAGGLDEALVTTFAGLSVAIPGGVLVFMSCSRLRRCEAALAQAESLCLGEALAAGRSGARVSVAARHSNGADPEAAADIDLSPMIDMVFILLIFFVVSATFAAPLEFSLDPAIPGNGSAAVAPRHLRVGAGGVFELDGVRIESAALEVELSGAAGAPLLVTPSQGSTVADLARVLDAAAAHGIEARLARDTASAGEGGR